MQILFDIVALTKHSTVCDIKMLTFVPLWSIDIGKNQHVDNKKYFKIAFN